MHKFMDREKFETAGDANEFIEKIYNSENLDSYVPESPEDRAQMMAYDVIDPSISGNGFRRTGHR